MSFTVSEESQVRESHMSLQEGTTIQSTFNPVFKCTESRQWCVFAFTVVCWLPILCPTDNVKTVKGQD